MVSERDTLLLESSKRFDQLKDDFQYNLALLDARDKEIQRLEAVAESGTLRIKELDIDKKSLLGKIETLMQNENMRINQFDQEKANNKKRLLQLKEEIEHTVWTSGETLKSKERDLTSLRVELTQQKAEYEEQIESQRNDLTKTFERLLQQREDSFKEKERQIGGQIDTLSYKFEHLKNENTRLKTESVEQKRRADLLHEENELKDENYRKLLWKMDDERAAMQRSEDAFQRNLQQLTMQISEAKAEAEKAGAEGQREIDLARNDCQREKELRHSAEKIVEDTRRKFFDEETRYQRELSEGRSREEVLMHEINSLRMERDDALNRLTHGKAEIDAITLQHRGLMRDLGSTKDDLLLTSKILEETEARLRTQEAQAEQDREAAIQALEVSESRARDEMFSFKDDAMHIQDKLKGDFEKARAQLKAEHEEHVRESNRVFDEKIKQLKSKLDEATSETARFRIQLGERDHELSEEKAEAAALKLRIRLHESQATASKDQIDRLQRHVDQSLLSPQQHASDSVRDSMRSSYGSDPERGSGIGFGRQSSFSYGKVPESPMFSEDFGPASVPLSPEPTPNRKFSFETRPMLHPNNYTDMSPSRMHAYGAYTGGAYAGGSPTGFQNGRSPPAIATIHEGLPAASPLTTEDPIVMENERLKTIIKDVSSFRMHIKYVKFP
jgi:chromosome segregation ATPase